MLDKQKPTNSYQWNTCILARVTRNLVLLNSFPMQLDVQFYHNLTNLGFPFTNNKIWQRLLETNEWCYSVHYVVH